MTEAKTSDYWIGSNAIYIQLNAMGSANYIQGNVASNAYILCYVKGIKGLEYDNGHNYQRWPLVLYPSVFPDNDKRYVYVAIPRIHNSDNDVAMVVFPSEHIDIYGQTAEGKQLGSTDYYFIFLQGIISASEKEDGSLQLREWEQDVDTGTLASDEAIANMGEGSWWQYNSVSDTITFLKTILSATFEDLTAKTANITSLFLGSKLLSGVAVESTSESSEKDVVTPDYLTMFGVKHFVAKDKDDVVKGILTFLKKQKFINGLELGDDFSIDGAGRAVLSEVAVSLLKSLNYNNAEQTGFAIEQKNGKYQMSITDLVVWGKAIFNTLQLRELSYVGGNIVLSPSASKLTHVVEIRNDDGEITGWKCYLLADDGTTATINSWKVDDQARCQTFNIKTGVYENVGNKDYWRRVTEVSQDNEVITDGNGHELYDGNKFAWIILSKTDCSDGADAVVTKNNSPAAGDSLVLIGNRTDKSRQNMLLMETEGSEAPRFVMYKGINNYSLTNRSIVSVSYQGIDIRTGYIHYSSPTGDTIWAPCYRGTWKEGTEYSYYDEVTWLGTRWLCIVPEGDTTITEPSEDNDYWRATTAVMKLQLRLYHNLSAGIARGETHNVQCRLELGDMDYSAAVKAWQVTRNTGDKTSDDAWALQDKVKNFKGSLDITWSNDNSVDDLGMSDMATFIFAAQTTTGDVYKQMLEI